MSLLLAVAPRVELRPQAAVGSKGSEAAFLGAACGLLLDEWQEAFLENAMSMRADDSWAASDVGLIASRQNGKNGAVEVRELYGLYVLNESIIHTAHLFKTTRESYYRLLGLVQGHPDVRDALVHQVASPASGYEMRFRGGGRIQFIARSRSSGRGLTGDLLVFDEAQDLNDDAQGALLPTISARPGAQAWYLGSAPGPGSSVFHRIRKRGRGGEATRLAYAEYSAEPDADLDDREAWRQANPAYGIRITEETIASERLAMSDDMFARERLSVSPDLADFGGVFSSEQWFAVCADDAQIPGSPDLFAFDVNPERSAAAVVALGEGPTLEVIDYRPGTGWLLERVSELWDRYRARFVVDRAGPAGPFVDELERREIEIVDLAGQEAVRAAGAFFDAVIEKKLRVRSDQDLDRAVAAAAKRNVGDAWAWGRRQSESRGSDISLLVAASLGLWEHVRPEPPSALPEAVLL